MNKTGLAAILCLMTSIYAAASAAGSVSQEAMDRAQSVAETYMEALLQGDLGELKRVMGGRLLAKKGRMLNNSDYSSRLLTMYSGASYDITGISGSSNDKVAVDARLNMRDGNLLDTRFIISRITDSGTGQVKYRITDEIY